MRYDNVLFCLKNVKPTAAPAVNHPQFKQRTLLPAYPSRFASTNVFKWLVWLLPLGAAVTHRKISTANNEMCHIWNHLELNVYVPTSACTRMSTTQNEKLKLTTFLTSKDSKRKNDSFHSTAEATTTSASYSCVASSTNRH